MAEPWEREAARWPVPNRCHDLDWLGGAAAAIRAAHIPDRLEQQLIRALAGADWQWRVHTEPAE
jgi:hypothetical protein